MVLKIDSSPCPDSFPVVNEAYLEFSLVQCEACDGDSKALFDPYLLILKSMKENVLTNLFSFNRL